MDVIGLTTLVLAFYLSATAISALAQTPPPKNESGPDSSAPAAERVLVIGSRVPRLDGETAVPVQVIRRDAIDRSGVSTTEELMARVSANSGGQTLAMGLGNSDSPGFSGASLRGLGSAETLVLLNGRRLGNYAFTGTAGPGVDLNAIPLAAIDRVEVLKDGASALYGADAIGGAINFVTRKDYAGSEGSLAYSGTQHGGGERTRATIGSGGGNIDVDAFNAFWVADLQRTERLRAVDRAFASTAYRPELGIDNTSPASYPANIVTRVNGKTVLTNPASPECTPLSVNEGGRGCYFDYAKTLELIPTSMRANLFGHGALRIAQDTDIYAELTGSWGQTRYAASPSPVSQRISRNNIGFDLPPTSPYYPVGLGLAGPLSLAYRTAELGPRTSEVSSTDLRLLAGLRTQTAGWDMDGAVSLNDSRSTERYLSGIVGERKVQQALASGAVNPFGPSSPEGLALLRDAELHGVSRRAQGKTRSADLRATRDLVSLPGGALGLATGVEFRQEELHDEQTSLLDDDVLGGGASAPKHGQRRVRAAYMEVVAPLAKGVELQAAARLDHYSDFGVSANPKIALRLEPAPEWLIRASLGRGFRAPSLPELYTQQTSSVAELQKTPDPVRCPATHLDTDCQPTVETIVGGNPALKPQTSTQANVGLVAMPAVGWQASIDLWSVRVERIIGALGLDTVRADIARYEGRNVFRGPVDPAYPNLPGPLVSIVTLNENLGDWRIDGADLSMATPSLVMPWGRFGARLDGTWVRYARQQIVEGNEVNLIGRIVPRWKQVLTLTGDRGPWSATLSNIFQRGYTDQYPLSDGSLRRVADFSVWDGQLAYSVRGDTEISLGIHNLFDRPPPTSNQSVQFQQGYDPIYADPLGRTLTVKLRSRWK